MVRQTAFKNDVLMPRVVLLNQIFVKRISVSTKIHSRKIHTHIGAWDLGLSRF